MMPFETTRSEQEVFDELEALCGNKGYIHILAYLSFRDNFISYSKEMTPEAMSASYDKSRTIRTEFSTLLGLMMKSPIDFSMPSPQKMQSMIEKTHALLSELHACLSQPMFGAIKEAAAEHATGGASELQSPFLRGDVLREPIFYGGESAYSFQYRDFAVERYAKDEDWLVTNKGFKIADGHKIASALARLQNRKLIETRNGMAKLDPSDWTLLPGFTFSLEELTNEAALPVEIVEAALNSLTAPDGPTNGGFSTLGSFNIANALPILRSGAKEFISLQTYGVVEALYDSPFYWMAEDKKYRDIAFKHRGEFTEECVAARLVSVFGEANVYKNVDVFDGKSRVCEVDILVLFADRALVIQCKSKKLTLEARKGNDLQLRGDFKKSVQDAYDQAVLCAGALNDAGLRFVTEAGSDLEVPNISEAYPICVVSDHYPALAVQARHFLEYQHDDVIQAPLVTDVFLIDVLAEMLPNPLWLLSYINRRANFDQRVMSVNELTILAFHLTRNLWVEDDLNMMILTDDLAIELDTAMTVRREGIEGNRTPNGIMTKLESTLVGRILRSIENQQEPALVDLGFMLLKLSGEAIDDLNSGLGQISKLAREDGKDHDFTIGFDDKSAGLTVHCGSLQNTEALEKLRYHCELRKYAHRAESWFGLVVRSGDGLPKFGLHLTFPWKHDEALSAATKDMPITNPRSNLPRDSGSRKIGRNEKCPCGSGKKFKKCCIR